MIRDLLKWVAPGAVTVLGGTAAALAMSAGTVTEDLSSRSATALAAGGFSWAQPVFSSRNAVLTGTASSARERDAAVARVAELPGVRSVAPAVTVAPLAVPYRLDAKVEAGRVSLSGSMPNAELQSHFAHRPGLAGAALRIRSGQPDEAVWQRGADFVLAQATHLAQGQVSLVGTRLDVAGSAASERALGELQLALAALPAGIELGQVAVEPVRINPYRWEATFDGTRIAVSGHAPATAAIERLRLAEVGGVPIATGLSLASGAPPGFDDLARQLLEQLARLEHGTASIVGDESRLTGAAPSLAVAQAVTETLSGAGSIVELAPPAIADYWVSASKQPGGVVVFDGYAPDAATREAFGQTAGADVNWLKLGRGAPAVYRVGVDFGLDLLAHLSEGRMALRGNILTLSGVAASTADFRALRASLDAALPQGIVLAMSEVKAPVAARYAFTITRAADGTTTLSGMLPGPELEASLLAAAGEGAASSVTYASGEPTNFAASAEQALHFMAWLQAGTAHFSGDGWRLAGTPASTIDKGAIETEFAVRGLAQAGWQLALTAPPPPPAPEPAESPAEPPPAEPPVAEAPVVPIPAESPAADEPPAAAETPAPVDTPATPAAPATAAVPATPAGFAACQAQLQVLSAHNAILFQSGAAVLTASAEPELDAFAAALAACPDAAVHVEGHTDSDGEARANLALSVARAEAVVNALIARGVAPARLYAIGYGESRPIADNASAEGKRQNRRIVVSVADPATAE